MSLDSHQGTLGQGHMEELVAEECYHSLAVRNPPPLLSPCLGFLLQSDSEMSSPRPRTLDPLLVLVTEVCRDHMQVAGMKLASWVFGM